jgi:hypothetical protein
MTTETTKRAERTFNLNGKWVPVGTLDEARRLWCEYRDTADGANGGGLGASDMKRGCGEYREGGVMVARVSYNGRMWAADGSEIK